MKRTEFLVLCAVIILSAWMAVAVVSLSDPPRGVRVEATAVVARAAPADEPLPILVPASAEYSAIDVEALRAPNQFIVCVDQLAEKHYPSDDAIFPAIGYLHAGDVVTIHERHNGWAMIEAAIWVWEPGLCTQR